MDYRFKPYALDIRDKFQSRTKKSLAIICTIRTASEQEKAILAGTSWTKTSKHLPQRLTGRSLAIDFCPSMYLSMKQWNPLGPLWWELSRIVKSYPNPLPRFNSPAHLRSGMDWHDIGLPALGKSRTSWDPGHVELVLVDPFAYLVETT